MTKNTIGGKGHKRGKNITTNSRVIPFKNASQGTDYAYVLDMLGNGRMRVFCYSDGKERVGIIRGSMYKRVWIAKDDVILVGFRDFQDNKCDVIFKYTQDEVRILCRNGDLSENYTNVAKKEVIVTDNDTIEIEYIESNINIDTI
jgi:translation initiation factor 1A